MGDFNPRLAKDQSTDEKVRLKKELDSHQSLERLFYDYDHMYKDNFSTNKFGNAQFFNF